jgi:hypothetical protein
VRLVDLAPRWFDVPGLGTDKDGITFLCPHCQEVRLGVQFANPVQGGVGVLMSNKDKLRHVHELGTFDVPPGYLWQRDGETFETLTLTPSVDASKSGHWHGSISNGGIQ